MVLYVSLSPLWTIAHNLPFVSPIYGNVRISRAFLLLQLKVTYKTLHTRHKKASIFLVSFIDNVSEITGGHCLKFSLFLVIISIPTSLI